MRSKTQNYCLRVRGSTTGEKALGQTMLRTFVCLVKAFGLSTESSGKPVHDPVTSGYASVMVANTTDGSNNSKLSAL